MSGVGTRQRPVTVVVESPEWTRQYSAGTVKRNPNGERFTAWMVIALVFMCGALALFDLYLLLDGLR